jgi:DNA-binding protein YbaB
MDSQNNRHLGKKVLYAAAITMSVIVILLSAVSILSVWLVEPPIEDTAVSLLVLVERSAGRMRRVNSRVDQTMGELQMITTEVADASAQLSQNVTDKGLVMVLLPEEKEQGLIDKISSVQETFDDIRDTVAQILDVYRSVNRLPFVSLPGLSEEQAVEIEDSVAQTRELVETLRSEIADFRTGVSGTVDQVEAAANLLTNEISSVRDDLSQLDSDLEALEDLVVRLQRIIPTALLTSAVILSLLLAFVVYTQVEFIRLFVARWRLLSADVAEVPVQEAEAITEET